MVISKFALSRSAANCPMSIFPQVLMTSFLMRSSIKSQISFSLSLPKSIILHLSSADNVSETNTKFSFGQCFLYESSPQLAPPPGVIPIMVSSSVRLKRLKYSVAQARSSSGRWVCFLDDLVRFVAVRCGVCRGQFYGFSG